MEDGTSASLLYEWNKERDRLNYAITEAESQLVSVNKRLKGLWQDLMSYVAILVLPVIFWFLLWRVGMWLLRTNSYVLSNAFVYVLVEGARALLMCIYFLSFPVLGNCLIKTITLLFLNRENPQQTQGVFPPEKGKVCKELDREATYRIEQQKLIHVLGRYYLYRDKLNALREEIDAGSISLDSLKQELEQFTYYETIHPANGFISPMVQKARQAVFIVLFGIAALFLLWWLIG